MKPWLWRVLTWMSQTVNVLLLFGHHDQTVSARCHINQDKQPWGVVRRVINACFFWQVDHCRSSFMTDVMYAREMLALLEDEQ